MCPLQWPTMQNCRRRPRLWYRNITIVLVLTITAWLVSRAEDGIEQHLRDQYVGKTLILRNFYSGKKLVYDSAGQLARDAKHGDWTIDGAVQLDKVRISADSLTIECKRLRLRAAESFRPTLHDAGYVRIEVKLGPQITTLDAAQGVLEKIFLTSKDTFAEQIPDYWQPCVLAGLGAQEPKIYSHCRFSPEFLAIPGVSAPPDRIQDLANAFPVAKPDVLSIGHGVTPPRATHSPDPSFTDEASGAKYQGAIGLLIVVDQTGGVRNIRVALPIGFGLDRQAVETVSQWRFEPARKDGQPVSVELVVKVDFRLFK